MLTFTAAVLLACVHLRGQPKPRVGKVRGGEKKLNSTVLSAEQELKTLRQFIPRTIFLWEPPFAKCFFF